MSWYDDDPLEDYAREAISEMRTKRGLSDIAPSNLVLTLDTNSKDRREFLFTVRADDSHRGTLWRVEIDRRKKMVTVFETVRGTAPWIF